MIYKSSNLYPTIWHENIGFLTVLYNYWCKKPFQCIYIYILLHKPWAAWVDLIFNQQTSGILSNTGLHNSWRECWYLSFIKRSRTSSAEPLPTCFLQTCCGFCNSSASSFFEIIIFTFPFASGEAALSAPMSFSFCTFPKLNPWPPVWWITLLEPVLLDVKSLQSSPSHSIDDAGSQQFPIFSEMIKVAYNPLSIISKMKIIYITGDVYVIMS